MKRGNWPENLIDSICEVIRDRRVELGLSVYEVSQRSGVSQQAISYYEKKRRRPTIDCLAKTAKALDLELSQLIAMAEKGLK